jgi:hypothetical protein
MLKLTGIGTIMSVFAGECFGQAGPSPDAYLPRLKSAHDRLAGYLAELVPGAKRQLGTGEILLMPQAGGPLSTHGIYTASLTVYGGMWPDDSLYPLMALPSLANREELQGTIRVLSDSVLELEYLPDRIEPPDGLPILSPGPPDRPPMTYRMPLHLPGTWVRLLDYYEHFGVQIPQKKAWAKLIERSVNRVPFANGLAYADPQNPPIGFGYFDSIKVGGWELMSSLVLMRGLERAVILFENEITSDVSEHWIELAKNIRANLYRLYDAKIGGYVEASRVAHQFSVWGNGLIYSLATSEARTKIVQFYRDHQTEILLHGCTRQIAEPGWEGNGPGDSYQNGGFWATGTGYVLSALAEQDPTFAVQLAEELVENLPKINFAEWIGADGKPAGAQRFLGSVSLPLLGLKSVLEKRPLLDYF